MQVTKHTSEGSTLALNPRADVTRSPKQGYQWPHKKDLCPPKIFFKKSGRNVLPSHVVSIIFLRYAFLPDLADLIDLEVDFYYL